MLSWTGVSKGLAYDRQYGYVRQTTEFGNYRDPETGAEIKRDNVSRHTADATRLSPVYRKKSQQLKYLKLNSNYCIRSDLNRFMTTEVRFLDPSTGQHVSLVSNIVRDFQSNSFL